MLNCRPNSWEAGNTDICGSGSSELFLVTRSSNAVSALCASRVLRKGVAVNTGVHLGRSCKATWFGNTALIVLAELWWWRWFLYLWYLTHNEEIKISTYFPVVTLLWLLQLTWHLKMTKFCSSWRFRNKTFSKPERKLCLSPVVPQTPTKALLVT